MDTSTWTALGRYFLWFCMKGIQFPTDHFVDPFQSSVCVCVKLPRVLPQISCKMIIKNADVNFGDSLKDIEQAQA